MSRKNGINLPPLESVTDLKSCLVGSKQAAVIDLLASPNGATMGQLLEATAGGRKPCKEVTIRSMIGGALHKKGYGFKSVISDVDVETFFLILPAYSSIPAPHRERKTTPKIKTVVVPETEATTA
jgi:hypothetical protein